MNALAKINEVPLTMTSREIAELTGKEHRNVMRDIRVLKEQLGNMFKGSAQLWTHPQNGQSYEEFALDKDTCLTLLLQDQHAWDPIGPRGPSDRQGSRISAPLRGAP